MGGKNLKIAIFIPTYNAAKTLPLVLDRIPEEIRDEVIEIFVADDASQDNTYLIGVGYKKLKGSRNLKIYHHDNNKGYGGNQKWAYNYCIEKGYDIVVMLHGDAQYAPEMIPKLLKPFKKKEADMVFGSRMTGEPLKGGMPLHKYLGNKILTWIENKALGLNLSEYHSGYRVYNCKALKKIPFNLCSDGFHFDTEILIQLRIANLRIKEMPIPTHYGEEKCHVNLISYSLHILKSLGEYHLSKKRIKKYEKFSF
ncbi:MAG: glycosyltransferase family 2 protein [Nanoarchaeota archaeon]|nr:glycosyltransferase family 2 protein [Nanoarchaeota archaeon]MBU1270151.1 glycosyltransferase family 2 protein [Nanoarchaeota archaeon]